MIVYGMYMCYNIGPAKELRQDCIASPDSELPAFYLSDTEKETLLLAGYSNVSERFHMIVTFGFVTSLLAGIISCCEFGCWWYIQRLNMSTVPDGPG